jgi:hypothetical protein
MAWPPVWRPIAVALGLVGYVLVTRLMLGILRGAAAPGGRAVRLGYAAASASAVVAGLMWGPAPLRSAVEAAMTLGVGPVGLLVAAHRAARRPRTAAAPILPSSAWIAAGVVVFGLFALVQGRGLGPLAAIGLPR